MRVLTGCFGVGICIFLFPGNAAADWGVAIENKIVAQCNEGWSLNITVSWDLSLTSLSIPVVVRNFDGSWAFWTDPLPVDTVGGTPVGVTWNWSNPGWAGLQELRPVVPAAPCATEGDAGYDGISPDHFIIHVVGSGFSTPPEPAGRNILTLTLWNNTFEGCFEFDTACFNSSMHTIMMIDDQFPPVDHGPAGNGETIFTKSEVCIMHFGQCPYEAGAYTSSLVSGQELEILTNNHDGHYGDYEGDPPRFYQVTGPGTVDALTGEWAWTPSCGDIGTYHVDVEVGDAYTCVGWCYPWNAIGFDVQVNCGCCDCGTTIGDLNCDDAVNPIDVIYVVNCVYKSLCEMCAPEGWCCPYDQGDVDCDGLVNPVDVAYYVSYVYKNITPFPCVPCEE